MIWMIFEVGHEPAVCFLSIFKFAHTCFLRKNIPSSWLTLGITRLARLQDIELTQSDFACLSVIQIARLSNTFFVQDVPEYSC